MFGLLFGRRIYSRVRIAAILSCAVLGGCQTDNNLVTGSLGPGGSRTITFESVDGPPQAIFQKLVAKLSTEAESRNLPVVSRTSAAAWRVKLYLAAQLQKKQATIAWVADVYDARYSRAFRVSGEEAVSPARKDVWSLADDAVLSRIAAKSLDAIIAQSQGAGSPVSPLPANEPQYEGQPVAEIPVRQTASFTSYRD